MASEDKNLKLYNDLVKKHMERLKEIEQLQSRIKTLEGEKFILKEELSMEREDRRVVVARLKEEVKQLKNKKKK